METLDDHEAKTKSFYDNVTNNDDVINKYDIALSIDDDHSMINDKVSQNYIDEDSLKSTKNKEISYNDTMSVVGQNFLMPSNGIKNIKQLYLVFYYNSWTS